jgi:hypothetical protein
MSVVGYCYTSINISLFLLPCVCRAFFIHPAFLYVRFRDIEFLQGRVVSRTPNQPTWRTRVSLLVWHLPRNLSDMCGLAATTLPSALPFEFIGAHMSLHPATKCFRQSGDTTADDLVGLYNQILLSEISDSHSGEYESDSLLLQYSAVYSH